MAKFKYGDKVKCTDDGGYDFLKDGKVFTILDCNEKYVEIENEHGKSKGGFYTSRFELVEEKKTMKFKVGDTVRLMTEEHSDGYSNPVWGGECGHLKGKVTSANYQKKEFELEVRWENGSSNNYNHKDLAFYPSLLERINNLTSFGQEAYEIMDEIGGDYVLTFPTVPKSGYKMLVLRGSSPRGSAPLKEFSASHPCEVGHSFKNALIWMAEQEGKLGPQVGDERIVNIEGGEYKVEILEKVGS